MARRTEVTTQQLKLPQPLVHCVFVTSSFVTLACALLALGGTCQYISESTQEYGPCPENLPITVFCVSGVLLVISAVLFFHIYCRRKKGFNGKKFGSVDGKHGTYRADGGTNSLAVDETGSAVRTGDVSEDLKLHIAISNDETENFQLTQKSADVEYWIEQQKPQSSADCSSENEDGDAHADNQKTDEITPL